MPLIILLAIAVVAGYLIAKSRASKTIDETAANVASTTKDAVTQTYRRIRGEGGKDEDAEAKEEGRAEKDESEGMKGE